MSQPLISSTYTLRSATVCGEVSRVDQIPGLKFRRFPKKALKDGDKIAVAVAYPTKKETKIAPLREAVDCHISNLKRELGREIVTTTFCFNVGDTGVGEQPFDPQGLEGALNRIYYIQDTLLGEKDWEQSFNKPPVEDFHRIIIPSMESDIFCDKEPIYDKPNVIFFECTTQTLVAGMGAGPSIQKDILELSGKLGDILFNDSKAVTYGNVLQALFSRTDAPVAASDWHRVVCSDSKPGEPRDRAYFVRELCNGLENAIAEFFDNLFKPVPVEEHLFAGR